MALSTRPTSSRRPSTFRVCPFVHSFVSRCITDSLAPLPLTVQGFFDGTKINIPYGDDGGELDPHGAENLGNPIGGNVTSNVTGSDVFYEEWMSFMSYSQSRRLLSSMILGRKLN